MTTRFRDRTIRVDRDVIEKRLRELAEIDCVYLEGGGKRCPDVNWVEGELWCVTCEARRLISAAETEVPA